ncbi:hypothetical protein M2114_000233 [Aurantimicrobium minutum]|uniref:HtaA domain-containing protein n=1 Tax=Aurantimicrobium minutum TaxID=708131 RepID=UPI00247525D9|nr:HtaA domain-containing protein [Aurantimicrobium minutum]MDH6255096.1 hypothetical protein [Aurantimicrobium minutum]MDH6409921.1 hypothetical protein [Aurantimicrobium minutum]MDH6424116.1 hypothetical protein [Aurantimicrobium minutum]
MALPQTLSWGIKESLLNYIESLDDGLVSHSETVSRDAENFTFPLNPALSNFDESEFQGLLQFDGEVTFTGYFGAMNIRVRNPQLQIKGGQGILSVVVESVFSGERYDPIAVIKQIETEPSRKFVTVLTAEGQMLFGPQYQPGQELSPLLLD